MENKLKIVYVPIEELKPSEYNPRIMTEGEANRLKDSLDEFGMVEPIVVNGAKERMNIIIGGHQRYNLCKMKGLKEMPVVYVNIPDIEKEQELNLRLNKNMGEWDWDMLANMDVDLLEEVGFDPKELDMHFGIDIEEDEIPEVPEKPISKLGEVYQLGGHRLMCGDSTKIEDVEKLMNGQKADMVFTDPPYGIDYSDTKRKFEKIIGDDKNPEQLVYEALSLHSGIPAYVCCNWQSMGNVGLAMEEAGFNIKSCIVWDKGVRIQNLDKFYKRHEFILYSGRFGGEKTIDGDVWQISRETRDDHPTAKPVELCARAIRYEEGNSILDLFGGSGTTLIACEQLDRTCYMMEIDPKYVDVIISRFEAFTGTKAERL